MFRHHLKKSITIQRNYSYGIKTIYPVRNKECMVLFMKKSHVASDCHLFLIQSVCCLRYTNRFVMHFSKGKLNVNTNS